MLSTFVQNQFIVPQETRIITHEMVDQTQLQRIPLRIPLSRDPVIRTQLPKFYEEEDLQKAKKLLGNLAESLTDDQTKEIMSEVQFLVDSWLDDFERSIFNGVTLQELLHERGGA